ncbi:hypothetical protein H5410_035277 [Solanum commersonii]|uniref:Uncharacterized protein n=1 Tax=Solanum commersonii TaxID=4109 RepID=A0A9J5Y1F5_SOLCO|nr:hypothetical protein H5410_035277 [Solanum commersonii]
MYYICEISWQSFFVVVPNLVAIIIGREITLCDNGQKNKTMLLSYASDKTSTSSAIARHSHSWRSTTYLYCEKSHRIPYTYFKLAIILVCSFQIDLIGGTTQPPACSHFFELGEKLTSIQQNTNNVPGKNFSRKFAPTHFRYAQMSPRENNCFYPTKRKGLNQKTKQPSQSNSTAALTINTSSLSPEQG